MVVKHTDSAAAEQAVTRAADLLSEGRVAPGRGRGRGHQQGRGLVDQAAVKAFDLAQPADQVNTAALGTQLQVSGPVPGFLTARADQHQLVVPHAAPPGALAALGVCLPHAAAITGHVPTPAA